MSCDYILSCESTVDLPYSYINGRNIPVLFYTYTVDGKEYYDDMERDPEARRFFFQQIKEGKVPATSQINEFRYLEFFEELVQKGDVIHVALGSGMTPSVRNAREAAEKLKVNYPDRKIIVIDSLCSCTGYGLLVDAAADLRDQGTGIEDLAKWLEDNKGRVQHQFFTTDLTQFKRSGRVSGPVALVGSMLGICPIMHLNGEGRIISYGKARGKKAAINTTVDEIMKHIQDGADYTGKLLISNANCPETAQACKEALIARGVNKADIQMTHIGMVIAAHCGPETVAIFFFGDERTK